MAPPSAAAQRRPRAPRSVPKPTAPSPRAAVGKAHRVVPRGRRADIPNGPFAPPPEQWTISVAKNGKKLGLTLVHEGKDSMGPEFAEIHDALKVTAILPGAIMDFNTANPDQAVKLGDLVQRVNEQAGSSDKMMKELGKAEKPWAFAEFC
eukprot:s2511_g4.t1